MKTNNLLPVADRQSFWFALILAASVAFSLAFACVTPLAAFAAMSALTLDRKNAMFLTAAIWLANQAVGYSLLTYPMTLDSIAWGAAIGIAAGFATFAARFSVGLLPSRYRIVAPAAAFAVAFASYELALFTAALSMLGGAETFTFSIVLRIFEINALAMTGLFLMTWAVAFSRGRDWAASYGVKTA